MMTKKQCATGYTKAKLAGHEILYDGGIAQCVTGAVRNEPLPTEERSSAHTLFEAVLYYLEHEEESKRGKLTLRNLRSTIRQKAAEKTKYSSLLFYFKQ
ncbi:hypothetical protein AVEN_233690-1 [Araneus ventricosus]|uniref:Uncharacterized protein n=1 Tax=Araneus ventricosus TaxID=182803 RepID=A0A4Y2K3R5_ARAVE|nr:hypothetical protein AVEN_233690-1 [Araneus ventricosus]